MKNFKKIQYKVSKNSVNMSMDDFYKFLETYNIIRLKNKYSTIDIVCVEDSEVEYQCEIFGQLSNTKISKELFHKSVLNGGYEYAENIVFIQELPIKESILKCVYTNKPIPELIIEEYNKQYEKK